MRNPEIGQMVLVRLQWSHTLPAVVVRVVPTKSDGYALHLEVFGLAFNHPSKHLENVLHASAPPGPEAPNHIFWFYMDEK